MNGRAARLSGFSFVELRIVIGVRVCRGGPPRTSSLQRCCSPTVTSVPK